MQKVRLTGAFLFCYLVRVHNSLPWKTTSLSLFWRECNSSSIRGQSMGPLWFYEAWAGYSLYGTKDKRHIGSTVRAPHWGMQCLLRGCTYWNEMWKKKLFVPEAVSPVKPTTLKWMRPVRGTWPQVRSNQAGLVRKPLPHLCLGFQRWQNSLSDELTTRAEVPSTHIKED